jgi:peroxiredoxin
VRTQARYAVLALLVVIAVFTACGAGARPNATPIIASGPGAPAIGKPPPNFTLQAADGRAFSLTGLRGRVVLVNFWATWCEPCKHELPAIDAVQRRFGARGFQAVGVDFADQDDVVRRFAAKARLGFPLLEDSIGATASSYRLLGVPTSYLVGADGTLRAIHAGPYAEQALANAVSALLRDAGR